MPTGTRHYRLRIRTPDDSADLFIATSTRDGVNPYIGPDAPSGEGLTLDPLTGKVTVGSYTVKVIDAPGVAYTAGVASYTDGWEYANQAAAEAAGWVFTDSLSTGSITVGATDQVHGGTKSLKFTTTGSGGASQGMLQAAKTYTGLTAGALHRVTCYGQMNARSWFDKQSWLRANGVSASITTAGSFELLTVDVRASDAGEILVELRRVQSFVNAARTIWFDDVSIQPLDPQTTLEGRIVTSALADSEARQQLLSKKAFVEESEDEGATWTVLTAGYVNRVALTDALLWEIVVGESQRVEQTKKVFDRISDPYEHPELIGIMDRASVIAGGPVVGDWGGNRDRGRPLFTVTHIWGTDIVELVWTNGGGSLHSVYKEDGPPMEDFVAEYMTDAAREYVDFSTWDTQEGRPFATCPDLVGRIYDAETSEWLEDQTVLLFAPEAQSPTDIGDWILCGQHGGMHVRWTGTVPSVGDTFRFAVFPKTTSERNPMHYSGHPMDLVKHCSQLTGISYDDTSRLAMRAYLGDDLVVHYRFTEGDTHQSLLEKTVYGPFGVAPRLNDDGDLEFFATRNPEATSVGTITLDDLTGEPTRPWGTDEQSAINRVIFETKKFALDKRRPDDHQTPFDARRVADVTVNVKEQSDQEQAIFGDRDVTFTLPGCIQIGEQILAAGTPSQGATPGVPGPLDLWVASAAQPIFDWQARGSIRMEMDVRRGVTDARVGDIITLDLPYIPSANSIQSPVSQRGTDQRKAIILRRTVKPECISLMVEDRGIDDTLACAPEFTLSADATFPKTTVEVEVTNEADLTHPLRVEMALGALEPSGNGQFVRFFQPNRDANPFDLPAVCAGSSVWVRMRCERNGIIGDWSAWQNLDLDDLTPPSSLAAVITNTTAALTWANGESTLPVEVLFKLATETDYHSAAILPAGSTAYTLLLTEAETSYDFAVRHVDAKGCTSSMATLSTATDVVACLDPPTNPAPFADGAGTYGLEVDAAVIPGGVEIWVATETAVGSGTPGTYSLQDTVTALAPPLRTRWTSPSPTPNDGLLRYLKAASYAAGYDSCDQFSDVVSVNPWTLVEPVDPGDPDDPTDGAESGITVSLYPIPLLRDAYVVYQPGADRTQVSPWRVAEEYPDLSEGTAVWLTAGIVASSLPAGALLGAEVEVSDGTGEWAAMGDDGEGPTLALDSTSLDALDENPDEAEWTVKGDAVTLLVDAKGPLRVRLVTLDGDETGAAILSWATLWVRQGPSDVIPDEPHDGAANDPGSCDTPGTFDGFTYADQATAFAAWPED